LWLHLCEQVYAFDMDTADLETRLADVCGVLNAAHAQLVALIAEALETGAWDVPGVRCAQHWVAWKTGLSPARAKQVVQIASRTPELPVTLGMFADGELAIDQVAVVSRFVPEHNDSQAAELAKHATVSQLSRSLASYWKGAKPAAPDVEPDKAEKDPEPEESVYAFFDDDARYKVHADLATERGAIVDKALEEARDALFQSGRKNVTWADALEEICLRSLGTITSATRTDRYRVVVHVDEHGGWLNAGARLKDSVLKDILSNPIIQPLFERDGRPVALGRSARVVPYRLAELIKDRDRTCRNPSCHATRGLEVHHLQHWTKGGLTNPTNLGCLCRPCHRDHHRKKFNITGNAETPGGLVFTKPNGDIIEPCGKPNPPTELPASDKPYQHPLGESFDRRDLVFNPPPGTPPAVTPQPRREPIAKPWMEPRPAPPVRDTYVPTEADRTRWAQERQEFFDLHKRLAREELDEIERLEQLDDAARLKHTDKAPSGLARLFA
jgi:Domain of unknown function (DUF222)/HNH endonuclease